MQGIFHLVQKQQRSPCHRGHSEPKTLNELIFSRSVHLQPASGWLTATSHNHPVDKKRQTGLWLTKPVLTIQRR